MSTADNPVSANAGIIIRRVLFFILLIGISLLYLLVTFRGLDSAKGMDQAQLAREIARNEGFTTKVLRPVSIWQNGEVRSGQPIIKDANRDTYHAPLHPILLSWALKFVGGDDADKWRMTENDTVYKLDRVVAATSVICFLIAIGVNYLLISRIFDGRIGGVTALLMLLCDLNWKFSQTGLPQMFMLLLFSCACFFAYRAVETTEEGRIAIGPALIAAAFLGLLALTHWLAIWIVLGFAVYAGFFLRPRGAAGLAALGFVLLVSLLPLIKNKQFSGSMGGTSILAVFNGLGTSEDSVMRTYNLQDAYLPLQDRKNHYSPGRGPLHQPRIPPDRATLLPFPASSLQAKIYRQFSMVPSPHVALWRHRNGHLWPQGRCRHRSQPVARPLRSPFRCLWPCLCGHPLEPSQGSHRNPAPA